MNNFWERLLCAAHPNSHAQFIHAGLLKLEAAVKFSRTTVAYSGPDKPYLNNSHIALLLLSRVYPSEMYCTALVKLSDTTAALLINNKLWALHCILVEILLASLQTLSSTIGFAFATRLTFWILFRHVFAAFVEFGRKWRGWYCGLQAPWEMIVQ